MLKAGMSHIKFDQAFKNRIGSISSGPILIFLLFKLNMLARIDMHVCINRQRYACLQHLSLLKQDRFHQLWTNTYLPSLETLGDED